MLEYSFARFECMLESRLRDHFGASARERVREVRQVPPPDEDTPYGRFVCEHDLDAESELLVMLALAPSIQPDFFDRELQKVAPGAGEYPQFGGMRGKNHRGLLPTGDTALFLLAGDDLDARMRWQTALAG